jgi:hypothetical protein
MMEVSEILALVFFHWTGMGVASFGFGVFNGGWTCMQPYQYVICFFWEALLPLFALLVLMSKTCECLFVIGRGK